MKCAAYFYLVGCLLAGVYSQASTTQISGPSDKWIRIGRPLVLLCTFSDTTGVSWYRDNTALENGSQVNITTDASKGTSTLSIDPAASDHSGIYTCVSSDGGQGRSNVQVVNAEFYQAIEEGWIAAHSWTLLPSAWILVTSLSVIRLFNF